MYDALVNGLCTSSKAKWLWSIGIGPDVNPGLFDWCSTTILGLTKKKHSNSCLKTANNSTLVTLFSEWTCKACRSKTTWNERVMSIWEIENIETTENEACSDYIYSEPFNLHTTCGIIK